MARARSRFFGTGAVTFAPRLTQGARVASGISRSHFRSQLSQAAMAQDLERAAYSHRADAQSLGDRVCSFERQLLGVGGHMRRDRLLGRAQIRRPRLY